jgi:hypothetical protein
LLRGTRIWRIYENEYALNMNLNKEHWRKAKSGLVSRRRLKWYKQRKACSPTKWF